MGKKLFWLRGWASPQCPPQYVVHVRILLFKLKTLYSELFLSDHLFCRDYCCAL